MKKIKSIAVLLMFLGAPFIYSCGNGSAGHQHNGEMHQHGESKEYTSAYLCPMHCDNSGGDEMGECPVCGMDYVAQDEHVKDGHTH